MTKNTRFFKAKIDQFPEYEILFRSLTIAELSTLNNINNVMYQAELAYELAVTKSNVTSPTFFVMRSVGEQILFQSNKILKNDDLFKGTIENLRNTINDDIVLSLILKISECINISFEYLFSCTYEDLLELAVMCEKKTNKIIFNFNQNDKSSNKRKQPERQLFIPEEDNMSLADKIKQQQKEFR